MSEKPIVTPLDLPEVFVVEPRVFHDERGVFFEAWNALTYSEWLGDMSFVQDNQSVSTRDVLRGLHYQVPPSAQGKLVRVVRGAAFDVVVDVRRSSPRFGRWSGVELSARNFKQLWIPPGFAHGVLAMSDRVEVLYKVTAPHDPSCEQVVRWDDPVIGIDWPLRGPPVLSPRDAAAPALAAAVHFD